MTLRTVLGNSSKQNSKLLTCSLYCTCQFAIVCTTTITTPFSTTGHYYLINWPEEGDALSVVPGHKIVSPPAEELTQGCMCKIKGFEKHLAKVIDFGTLEEMNSKVDLNDDDIETQPPKKKARIDKENVTNTPRSRRKVQNKTNKKTKKGTVDTVYCV